VRTCPALSHILTRTVGSVGAVWSLAIFEESGLQGGGGWLGAAATLGPSLLSADASPAQPLQAYRLACAAASPKQSRAVLQTPRGREAGSSLPHPPPPNSAPVASTSLLPSPHLPSPCSPGTGCGEASTSNPRMGPKWRSREAHVALSISRGPCGGGGHPRSSPARTRTRTRTFNFNSAGWQADSRANQPPTALTGHSPAGSLPLLTTCTYRTRRKESVRPCAYTIVSWNV
jgi:hypothetical protein